MSWQKTGIAIVIKIFSRNRDKNVISKDCNKMFIAEVRYLFTL